MGTNPWEKFCEDYQVFDRCVPLFETIGNLVEIETFGKDQRPILRRSAQMESLVIGEVSKVLRDFEQKNNLYQGLIYVMFWELGNQVVPLYIGKSEKYGKGGGNLSANIMGISSNKGKFCRWGSNYAYHIGDLSAVVCNGHPLSKQLPKYKKWAEQLFQYYPSNQPILKRSVHFWIHAWETGCLGPWHEQGPASLTSLEYQLIDLGSKLFPDSLLNQEGVNRS